MKTVIRFFLLLALALAGSARGGALEDYVHKDDGHFGWAVRQQGARPEGVYSLLELTSQVWRTAAEVSPCVWRHWLEVYIPAQVDHETALLEIAGGDQPGQPPGMPDGGLGGLAVRTHAVTARIHNVPNQPLSFSRETPPHPRREDQILAFAWARSLETRDPTDLAHLAMVKSVVRAMDAVTQYCAATSAPVRVRHFVLTGASKRGWTTWLAAAADPRVAGIAPRVIDLLHMEPSFRHHFDAYGRYADAVHDYVQNGILARMGRPESEASLAILDPWSHRERLTMPKLIVNSTGDQFFLPDSWRFYWEDLKGPKWLRYVPNTDHGLNGSANETVESFFRCLLAGTNLPAFAWHETGPGRLRVEAGATAPLRVLAWRAVNPSARDFRLQTIGPAWASEEVRPAAPGVYEAAAETPAKGWAALLLELQFPDPLGDARPLILTTGVSVTPDTYPRAPPSSP